MRAQRLSVALFAITILLALPFIYSSVKAQDELKATQIDMSTGPAEDAQGAPLSGQYVVTAVLTSVEGKNVGRREVTFTEDVEFFRQRQTRLGSDITDRKGTALMIYHPAQSGEHVIVASFAGDDEYAASEVKFTFIPTEVVPPFASQPLPLAEAGKWLAITVAFLGVAFWAVLLGVVGRSMRQIKTAGASPTGAPAD